MILNDVLLVYEMQPPPLHRGVTKSRIADVTKHDNLIVLRTFSKRAALAGMRIGYGAFPKGIIEYMWRAKQPYNVSVAAEVAACAALSNPDYLKVRLVPSYRS